MAVLLAFDACQCQCKYCTCLASLGNFLAEQGQSCVSADVHFEMLGSTCKAYAGNLYATFLRYFLVQYLIVIATSE